MEERQADPRGLIDAAPSWDATQTRILDAADSLLSRRGVNGVTIAELARRSELSRPTIYRSWSDADDVVRSALLRRVIGLIHQLPTTTATRSSLVEDVMRFITLFRGDPVYARLLADEPEAFTRYTLQRVGSSQRMILEWLAAAIVIAQADGSVRRDPPDEIAVMVLLVAQSAVLSQGTVAELISESAWERELRTTIDGLLRP